MPRATQDSGSSAVEFNINPRKEGHLLAALQQVLSNYPFDE